MLNLIIGFNWISFFMLLFTIFLVGNDMAFSKKVRLEFQGALITCLLLAIITQCLKVIDNFSFGLTQEMMLSTSLILRQLVFLLLIFTVEKCNKIIATLLNVLFVINAVFVVLNQVVASFLCLFIFVATYTIVVVLSARKDDIADYFFVTLIFMSATCAVWTEYFVRDTYLFNSALSIITCLTYYYFVMRMYKKDNLTGLLMRHNLNYEMADLVNKDYDIVLIDVDNFKLINDKYGHDKGDEALVNIVETTKAHLLKGCRLYRFGGDEFVIISRKVSKEELIQALEDVNSDLVQKDLHISFGVVKHKAGDDGSVSLVEADKVMYENKRALKSEDIWDDMTGLYNYRGFLDEMDTFIKAVQRDNNHICLVAVDVESLSNINLAYGYTEGNLVLKTLARVLKTCLRGRDFIGHIGSDEFAIAIECKTINDEYADGFANIVQEGMDSAYEFSGKDYSVKLNFGKYYIEESEDLTPENAVNSVLYAKQEDKENRRKTDVNDQTQDYNNTDEKLVLEILDTNNLKYAFQPIVSAKDGEIVGYEALMRSGTETRVSPLKILKYAERNKRSYVVEKYTFFNVLDIASKEADKFKDRRVFLNSIPGYFLNDDDYNEIKEKYGDLFEKMVVEITEQRELDDDDFASLNSKRDKDKFNIAIDDYGSGCSNTNSLLRYMPQVVKLDRLLVAGIDRNAKKQFFVDSIIKFARENDMLILAEGVETESELKAVIRLGADMIQGYITSKPSFEIIDEIPKNIKKLIIDENLKVGTNQRRTYTAAGNCELSVVHLAMEDYSKINIAADVVTLTGSAEYTADMVIRIKDGITSLLTLSNVRLNSVDDEPCIEVGENSHLTINLQGHSRLNTKGIHVPSGSSLTVVGPGNMEFYVKGHQCYAIGADTESEFGKLTFKNSGRLDINVDGEYCVGIGGGTATEDSEINITAGSFGMNVAGVSAVAIGCYRGNLPIKVVNCEIVAVFRVNQGTIIGNLEGPQNILVKNFNFDFKGSGTDVCGIGSINKTSGTIEINSGSYEIKANGHSIILIGAIEGDPEITCVHSRLEMMGEGDNVIGFGTGDEGATINLDECSMNMVINAANPNAFVGKKNIEFKGPLAYANVNGLMLDVHNLD